MKLELKLKDETVIDLIEAAYPKHYVLACKNGKTFQKIWNKMTEENLSEIRIMEDDELKAVIVGSRLAGTQTVTGTDGTLIGHFYMDGGIEATPEEETAE